MPSPAQTLTATATAADTRARMVGRSVNRVDVVGAGSSNDFITLPPLKTVPNGWIIHVLCSAGSNFELRTPVNSNEEINSEDCDGTKEYLCTDGNLIKVTKVNNTIGWEAHEYTPIGAVVTAVVPN